MKPSFILFLISSVSYFGSIDTASSGMWNKLFGYGSFDECMIGEMEGKDKSLYGHVYRDCLKKTSKKKSAKEKERDRIRRQEQKQHQYDNTRVTCNLRNKRDISLNGGNQGLMSYFFCGGFCFLLFKKPHLRYLHDINDVRKLFTQYRCSVAIPFSQCGVGSGDTDALFPPLESCHN